MEKVEEGGAVSGEAGWGLRQRGRQHGAQAAALHSARSLLAHPAKRPLCQVQLEVT